MSEATDRAPSGQEQNERVRERFTRTADAFARMAMPPRSADAEMIVRLAAPGPTDHVLDLACGPGTFTTPLARHAKFVFGLDLTPALLDCARRKAGEECVANIALVCADATAIPFPDASLDVACCGYSFHHMADPARALAELARVLRPGGRLAVVDLYVPEGADPERHNAIERARDVSHTHTLTRAELPRLVEAAGFLVRATEVRERPRHFSEWMPIAGWKPGDPAWRETRRLLLATLADDAGGFHPRLLPVGEAPEPEIEFVQSSLFLAATKQ
jgi:ubiquinone/menaquinone biosynthesis C-methylase UbiE